MHDVIRTLFAARDAAHALHLKTRSFARHLALGDLYEGLLDKADELAEAWQGKYGLMDIGTVNNSEFMQASTGTQNDEVAFIRQLAAWVESIKQYLDKNDTFILNLWDEIIALVYKAKYKLENLS